MPNKYKKYITVTFKVNNIHLLTEFEVNMCYVGTDGEGQTVARRQQFDPRVQHNTGQ